MTEVTIEGSLLRIGTSSVTLEHPVREAFLLNGRVIVLMDPDSQAAAGKAFRNLIALDLSGRALWTADLPTAKLADAYTRIVSRAPLRADSFSSCECEIDASTGRLVSAEFFK